MSIELKRSIFSMKYLAIFLMSLTLWAPQASKELATDKISVKVNDNLQIKKDVFSDKWRFTVKAGKGQLVRATFSINVDETLDTAGLPASQKVQTFQYVPSGQIIEEIEFIRVRNPDRRGNAPDNLEWKISGFGQQVKLGPMEQGNSGGGTADAGGLFQRASRRISLEDRNFTPTKRIEFEFELETVSFDQAKTQASNAGLELPERKDKPWTITIPISTEEKKAPKLQETTPSFESNQPQDILDTARKSKP